MKNYNLTEGNILNKLLLVALPIMGTQFIQMTYNMVDMIWLGRVGKDAVASSGTAGLYMWLFMAFLLVGRMGSEIGVSQHLGKKDIKNAKEFSQNSLFISFILGCLCSATCLLFSKQLISFFNIQEPIVAQDSARFLSIVGLACPFTFVTASLTGSFNGSGNSKLSFIANLSGLALNIALDPILIFFFHLGVIGAAIATATAQTVVCIIFLVSIKKHKERPFSEYSFLIKPSLDKLIKIFKWTAPIAIESFLFSFFTMKITSFVSRFGAGAISVQSIGSQIESLTWLIGGGYGSALTAFVGQNFGAKKWGRIHKGFKISIYVMSIWGVIVTLILFFGGKYIFYLFIPDDSLLNMGDNYLKILAFCQLVGCLEAISSGTFRGTGRTIPPSLVSVISNFLRIPMAYFLSLTSLGLNGIWLGITIGAFIRGAWIFIWRLIRSRKEPKHDLNENPEILCAKYEIIHNLEDT
ncbi:MAG: MATE family efflux transporter [Oscillospiraceae bacterium]|nr:MATE family efflux transporter [Oscillospiraceae bacterium]